MSRRLFEDSYNRATRDRSGRDPRDVSREQYSRDPVDSRDQRRVDERDSDHTENPRHRYSDLRSTRDAASRPVYGYAEQNDRDESPPRGGYMDDPRDRHRQLIDLQSGRREDPASRYQEYFLPGEEINREVIQYDICRYLGNDATVRPYAHVDGRQGYLIKAYRAPTTAMITTIKQDSKRFEVESAQRRRQFGQSGVSYPSSTTFDDRQRQGRPDVRPEVTQSGYAGYRMDTTIDDYDDREPPRNYRDQEPRMDMRPDQRQQLLIDRHGLPVSQGYPQDPAYPSSYPTLPASSGYSALPSMDPRTLGPNSTPPPPIGRNASTLYGGSYSNFTSGVYSGVGYPSSTAPNFPSTTIGLPFATPYAGYQAGARHPGWGDTPNFQNDTAR